VKNDPPQIFYGASPAILLIVQGDPVLAPIAKTDLEFVVNTNWDLFFEKSKKDYFLLVNNAWLTARELKGPWTQTQTLPKDLTKLPAGQNFDEVKKFVPPPPPSGAAPQIFFTFCFRDAGLAQNLLKGLGHMQATTFRPTSQRFRQHLQKRGS
jgi:hypothetical protein